MSRDFSKKQKCFTTKLAMLSQRIRSPQPRVRWHDQEQEKENAIQMSTFMCTTKMIVLVIILLLSVQKTLSVVCRVTYVRMLQKHPSMSIAVVERCIRIRGDLKKRQSKAVMDSIQAVQVESVQTAQDSVFGTVDLS